MKLLKLWKDIRARGLYKEEYSEYYLSYNTERVENIVAINCPSHHDIYKRIRNFSTPIYQKCFFFRNKKAFNTFFFKQNYDVVVADGKGNILELLTDVKRGIISNHYKTGFNIFFFAVGTIKNQNWKRKNSLRVAKKWL